MYNVNKILYKNFFGEVLTFYINTYKIIWDFLHKKKQKGRENMETEKGYKTPDYVRRAVDKYRGNFDTATVRLPKGTAQVIREQVGKSVNGYVVSLVREDLTRRGLLPPQGDKTE